MTATGTRGNVLITKGTRPLAQRVAKLLPAGPRILFGSSDEVPDVLLRTGNYLRIPRADAAAFVHEVLKICLDREVATLIPLGADELYPMAEARLLFDEYGIAVCVPEKARLTDLVVIENPPRQLPLLVLHDGRPIHDADGAGQYDGLSGVFTPSDSGDEWALCCIAD